MFSPWVVASIRKVIIHFFLEKVRRCHVCKCGSFVSPNLRKNCCGGRCLLSAASPPVKTYPHSRSFDYSTHSPFPNKSRKEKERREEIFSLAKCKSADGTQAFSNVGFVSFSLRSRIARCNLFLLALFQRNRCKCFASSVSRERGKEMKHR